MKKRFILSAFFLILGILIYYLYNVRILKYNETFCLLIRNYIPDVCWTISFFFTSINFTKNITKNDLFINSIYVFLIAYLYEISQFFNIVKGTFDLIDIVIYLLAIIIADILEMEWRKKENV